MVALPIILTGIMGFIIAELLGGKTEGHRGKFKSIRIKVRDYTVHVHHWLYASMAIFVLPSTTQHRGLIEAFLIGIAVHGLTYRDFYKVIYKESENH